MRGFLPHHAFNAYDQVNAANVIVKEEGFIINSTGANRELAETVRLGRDARPTLSLSLSSTHTDGTSISV